MAEYQANNIRDGKGGLIKFPVFISQADMDLIEKEFVVKDDDFFIVTYPRSGTTWTEQIVHLLVNHAEQGEQRLTDAVPWVEKLRQRIQQDLVNGTAFVSPPIEVDKTQITSLAAQALTHEH